MISDEAAFLETLRKGDAASYETLVREYSPRMLSVARRMLGSEDEARDALQEAFVNAFRGIDAFAGDCPLGAWLHRIVVNASLMKLRTRRRRPERSIDELLPRFLEDGHREDPGPAWPVRDFDEAEERELRARVRACIDELPEIYRTALVLRDIEGFDASEGAAALGIGQDAFKMRVHRARQALRTLLEPFYLEQRA